MEMSEPTKPKPVQASGAQLLGRGGLVLAHLLPSCSSSATHMAIMYAQLHLSFSANKPPWFTHLLQNGRLSLQVLAPRKPTISVPHFQFSRREIRVILAPLI